MVTSSMTDANPNERATEPVVKSPATVSPMDNILIADCHFVSIHFSPNCIKPFGLQKISKLEKRG